MPSSRNHEMGQTGLDTLIYSCQSAAAGACSPSGPNKPEEPTPLSSGNTVNVHHLPSASCEAEDHVTIRDINRPSQEHKGTDKLKVAAVPGSTTTTLTVFMSPLSV